MRGYHLVCEGVRGRMLGGPSPSETLLSTPSPQGEGGDL